MTGPQLPSVDRRLLVGGAGLAGVVLGWVLLVTVFGGGDGENEVARPRASGAAAVVSTTAPPTSQSTYVPASRDPFQPNVTVPRAPLAAQSPVPAATVPTATTATTTAAAAATKATPGPVDPNTSASLELKSVATDGSGTVRATITVDGKAYTPATGEAFAHGYRLERIAGNCVEVSAQAVRAQMCVAGR